MVEYPKIQTVFLRDPATKFKTLLLGQYAKPEFEYLARNDWMLTEKIDGMNIRVIFTCSRALDNCECIPPTVRFAGKTDKADLPKNLLAYLQKAFTPEQMQAVFKETTVTLYGEGFGAGIQKGGVYSPDQRFILFDVLIGTFWLERPNIEEIAASLNIPVVHRSCTGSLLDMVDLAKLGFPSFVGEGTTHIAEGIVARPLCELQNRRGERIITKIKHKDFAAM